MNNDQPYTDPYLSRESRETINHSPFTNLNKNQKAGSIPVIFSPPKVESKQITKKINVSSDDTNEEKEDSQLDKEERNETVAALAKEFSHMFEESLDEGFSSEFDETETKEEDIDPVTSLYEEEESSNVPIDELVSSMLEENADPPFNQESQDDTIDETHFLEDTFLSLLSESESDQEEASYIKDFFDINSIIEATYENNSSQVSSTLREKQANSFNEEDIHHSTFNPFHAKQEELDEHVGEESTLEDEFVSILMNENLDDEQINSAENEKQEDVVIDVRKRSLPSKERIDSSHEEMNFSLQEELYDSFTEHATVEDEFASMLAKANSDDEDTSSYKAENKNDKDEFASKKKEHLLQHNKSHSLEKENKELTDQKLSSPKQSLLTKFEKNTPIEDEFALLLKSADSEHAKDRSTNIERSSSPQETSSISRGSPDKKEEDVDDDSKKKSHHFKKNLEQHYEQKLYEEDDNDLETVEYCIEKKPLLIVKLPILLANVLLDIDIMKTIDLLCPIQQITKIEWCNQSLECQVISPSATAFFKGVLIIEVEYVQTGKTNTIHSVKFPIPWSKTSTIDWLALPHLGSNNEKEFTFQSPNNKEIGFHHEFYEEFTEPITNQLRHIHFVWHHDLVAPLNTPKLSINGTAHLTINLSQEQFIELNNIERN